MPNSTSHSSEDDTSSDDRIAQQIENDFDDRFAAAMDAQIEGQLLGTSRCRRRPGGTRRYIERNREEAHQRLVADYFSDAPVYTDAMFRRRYRMRRPLFLRIVEALGQWSPYFRQRTDALNKKGFSPLQKCTAAMRMLAYGCAADSLDESLRIGASTVLESLKKFVKGVNEVFGPDYLRRATPGDIQQKLQMGQAHGFPGMLGSLDCMH